MPENERRQTPRTTMERLAYINIEPNNGGIVLNVSDQGLCFHSIAPVVRNGKLRFSLLEHNRKIEADGELVWIDDGQKVGGVRFSALPAEARAQIQSWITEPAGPFSDDEPSSSSTASTPAFHFFNDRWTATAPAPAAVSGVPIAAATEKHRFLAGFSGGLAIGLAVAVLVTVGFLFQLFRHQVGESLIALGQQLSAKPPAQTQPSVPNPPAAIASSPTAPLPAPTVASTPIAHAKPGLQAQPTAPEAQPMKTEPEIPAKVSIKVARNQESTSARVAALAAPSLNPPPIALPSGSAAPIAKLIADKASVLPRFAPVNLPNRQMEDAGAGIPGPPPKMYFEVGKFKQESWARKATDELAQLGLPTSVAQKGRLWGNSYYVLVGPYSDRDTAAVAHKTLASSGFKPRPFERGSRSFTLSSGVILNRTRMVGDFVIRWESYVPEAKVKFLQDDLLVTSADGTWVDRGIKNQHDAFVYQRNPDGTHTLLEIRFAGMSKVLVFGGPS
jgi:hypothetical protein